MRFLIYLFLVLTFLSLNVNSVEAQKKSYLQIDFGAGLSVPVKDFNLPFMFAGRGYSASGGFDYFFGKFGFGFNGGYFMNPSQDAFSAYISHRFLEDVKFDKMDQWTVKYGALGPIYKFKYKKIELDLFARAGYSQIHIPELTFNKVFFSQNYEVYRFGGNTNEYQFAWNTGTRVMFKFNRWLGIQAKAEYFATTYMSDIAYDYSFRETTDANRNGKLEDSEYFEAEKVSILGNTDLTVLNLNLGLVFQLGTKSPVKTVNMIPLDVLEPEILVDEVLVEETPIKVEEADTLPLVTTIPDGPTDSLDRGPIVNIKESQKKMEAEEPMKQESVVEIPVAEIPVAEIPVAEIPVAEVSDVEDVIVDLEPTSYDAPEAKYDEEAAAFLYKAGESYFAANDFENAVPCFNKLKADPKYPRAKYMFALSLCSMGNCSEATKEYKEFSKVYKAEDSRTLEIIYASHIERCKSEGRIKLPTEAKVVESKPEAKAKMYKIQFIAIYKSNLEFPKLTNIGDISTEFYPNKSVYRYTLGGYTDYKSAVKDVVKVKKMGFRDAFIAVYENGVRVNTLYHSK